MVKPKHKRARLKRLIIPLLSSSIFVAAIIYVQLPEKSRTNSNKRVVEPQKVTLAEHADFAFTQLNQEGNLLAYTVESDSRSTHTVNVIDPDNSQLVTSYVSKTTDYFRFLGWDDSGNLWVITQPQQQADRTTCLSATMLAKATANFVAAECSAVPESLKERSYNGLPTVSAPLPANAEVNPVYKSSSFQTGQLSHDRGLYAMTVTERYYKSHTRSYAIPDVLLLNGNGKYGAQFDSMTLVGWTAKGSLIVQDNSSDLPVDRLIDQDFTLARIDASEIRKYAQPKQQIIEQPIKMNSLQSGDSISSMPNAQPQGFGDFNDNQKDTLGRDVPSAVTSTH